MGRKRGKVRWTSVEEGFFAEDGSTMKIDDIQAKNGFLSDENTNVGGPCIDVPQNRPHQGSYYSHNYRRNYNRRQIWASGGVAPRFERKAPESRGSYAQDSEGEEQLPNGFYKIRSKNLDVLFKKDYYAHRSHMCMTPMFPNGQPEGEGDDNIPEVSQLSQESSAIEESQESNEHPMKSDSICTTTTDPVSLEATECRCACWVANNTQSSDEVTLQSNLPASDETLTKIETDNSDQKSESSNPEDQSPAAPKGDPDPELHQRGDEGEKQDPVVPKKSTINENASPFYPSGYIPSTSPMFMQHSGDNPPTLYLYTPGSQSIVPCDEIVITSPIIAPDGTALFPTASNVYLPFDGMMNSLQYLGTQVGPSGLIQYDQYGVPYTTFHQQQPQLAMVSPGGESGGASPPVVADSEESSPACLSESNTDNCSESTPNSPPDLSVYSPGNWNANTLFVPEGYAQAQWFPHQYYFQQQSYSSNDAMYSKSRGSNNYYQSNSPYRYNHRDGNWIPSSTGESLAEEEDDSIRKVAPRGNKDERKWGDNLKEEIKEPTSQRLIPGLPPESMVQATKKVQKKRRKKKIPGGSSTTQTNNEANLTDKVQENGNMSSSEDDLSQKGRPEVVKEEAEDLQKNTELPLAESMEAEATTVQEPVRGEIIEEVVKAVEVEEPQERPRPRSRGRRGGQKHRIPSSTLPKTSDQIPVEVTIPEVQIVNDDQWEMVPNEIKESKFDKWETSVRGKRSKKGGRQFQVHYLPVFENHNNKDTQECQEEKEPSGLHPDQIEVVPVVTKDEPTNQTKNTETYETKIDPDSPQVSNKKQRPSKQVKQVQKQQSKQKPVEPKLNKDSTDKLSDPKPEKKIVDQIHSQAQESNPEDKLESMSPTSERSASVSSSTTNTLKKKSKKKPVGDENKSNNVKQVLVHDGMLNFAEPGIAGAKRLLKRPNDLINEHAFVLKDIGHGMRVGPMGTGRINQGKYQPPDRSAEILFQFMKQQRDKVMHDARLQFANQPLKITKLLEITDPKQQEPQSGGEVVVGEAGSDTATPDLD